MKKTLEEITAEAMETVRKAVMDAASESYGQIVADHLPYADQDIESNAYFRANEMVQELLEGKTERIEHWLLCGYVGADLRAKILEQLQDKIVKAEIDHLRDQLARAEERLESLRRF